MQFNPSYVIAVMVLFAAIETIVLFIPVSVILRVLYRRIVVRGMRRCAPEGAQAAPIRPAAHHVVSSSLSTPNIVEIRNAPPVQSPDAELYEYGMRRMRAMISDHMLAGAAYIAVWLAGMLWIVPGKLGLLIALYALGCAFPAILAWTLIILPRLNTLVVWAGYFTAVVAMSLFAADQTGASADSFLGGFWLLGIVLCPLILLGARMGSIGLLVSAFLWIVSLGQWLGIGVLILVFGFWWIPLGAPIGLSANQTMVVVTVLQLLVFSIPAVFLLRELKRRYEGKKVSDQSLAIDAAYVFSALLCATALAFSSIAAVQADSFTMWPDELRADIRAFLMAPIAFAAYKITLLAARAKRRLNAANDWPSGDKPYRLLVLRAFSLRGRSRRMFRIVERFWRYVGPVQMIAGPDLALITVEPHEALNFLSRRLSQQFLARPMQIDESISLFDQRVDADGRYRVFELFCQDDTWRAAFAQLALSSDAILMDVRGFTSKNSGCVFELSHLLTYKPGQAILLLVDGKTDLRLINYYLGSSLVIEAASACISTHQPVSVYRVGLWTRPEDVLRLISSVAAQQRRLNTCTTT